MHDIITGSSGRNRRDLIAPAPVWGQCSSRRTITPTIEIESYKWMMTAEVIVVCSARSLFRSLTRPRVPSASRERVHSEISTPASRARMVAVSALRLGELRLQLLLQTRAKPFGKGASRPPPPPRPPHSGPGSGRGRGTGFPQGSPICRSPARRHSLTQPPGVVGVGDAGDVGIGKLFPRAVHHEAQLAGVDEQHLAAPVSAACGRARCRSTCHFARNHRQAGIWVE